jgi:hypothetical protein
VRQGSGRPDAIDEIFAAGFDLAIRMSSPLVQSGPATLSILGLDRYLPGILHFVVMQFCGEDVAWEERDGLRPGSDPEARRRAASEMP